MAKCSQLTHLPCKGLKEVCGTVDAFHNKVLQLAEEQRTPMTTLRQRQTSSSAVTEKPRDESAILKGRVTLRLNFKLRVNFAPISMDR